MGASTVPDVTSLSLGRRGRHGGANAGQAGPCRQPGCRTRGPGPSRGGRTFHQDCHCRFLPTFRVPQLVLPTSPSP